MSLDDFWNWIQDSELSFQIGATYWFPLLESFHVLAVAFLVGSIMVVDLRLLGVTALRYPVTTLHSELTRWSWAALVLAVVTGLGLFISRPGAYAANTAFQIKLVLLLAAGMNLVAFRKLGLATIAGWDDNASIPGRVRAAGLCSLLIWGGVIIAGRWVGHSM